MYARIHARIRVRIHNVNKQLHNTFCEERMLEVTVKLKKKVKRERKNYGHQSHNELVPAIAAGKCV